MLENILQLKNKQNSINEFIDCIRQGIPSAVFGVTDYFKYYLVSALEEKVLFVVKDNITGRLATQAIKDISGKKAVFIPPKDEILLFTKAFSKDNLLERITALDEIKGASVIVATPESLMQLSPKNIQSILIERDMCVSQNQILLSLVEMGYMRVESVETQGQFSLRGDILDVFPINLKNAVRIDFFGDNIESIKQFDPLTRENLGFTSSVKILQASEFVFTSEDFITFENSIKEQLKRANKNQYDRLKSISGELLTAIQTKSHDRLSPLATLSPSAGSVFDYLDKNAVVVIDEARRVNEIAELNYTEFSERFKSLYQGGEVFSFSENNFISVESLTKRFKEYRLAVMQTLSTAVPFFNPLKIISTSVSGVANYQLDFKELFTDIDNWLKSGYSITVCTGDKKRAENLCYELSCRGIASSVNKFDKIQGVNIITDKLSSGFVFHQEKFVLIGSGNLYAKPISTRKIKSNKKAFFTAPEVGDYCVHEVHGVGRVLGNKKISTTEGTKDYVAVEYQGGDILYVPVEQMDILTRYLGGESKPKLSKIGGKDFERIKNSVRESIKKMSFDLKKLYQERDQLKGYKFIDDKELQTLFESAFPYEDTPDQAQANLDIRRDMTSGKIMDRLVCGDVGFGKTEVAFRAIFRAVANGMQTAMLAPTTILTEQHYNTAVERFKNFGITIACLNRFKTPKQQKKIIDDIKEGKVDFVIGTHRLLSKDIEFKNLGLLVLDEEQRFGVEHKEKIKLLKKDVATLTLTATPIPRTLHMSLSGIRSISTINTPPKKRLPVQTYVTEETDMLIKDAVTKEINRGGQAFILYNRVESIFTFAERIKNLLPNVKITVVHGQMEERVMESNILNFYRGESQVLISTTIIENGIDLPKANTLVVIDADKLGLSTLYQLKGRVGRSDRLAYAYFTFKPEKILSNTAFDRLNAIIEFTEMGSGIKIAMRDLEIRGAGNILGAEQHGHMEKIGYELYSKLLREEISGKEELVPELDIRVSAFIPDDYISSNIAKMDAYKEIAEIDSLDSEKDFRASIEDIYGHIPSEVDNLINIAVVKMLAKNLRVKEIIVRKTSVCLVFNDFKVFGEQKFVRAMDEFSDQVNISMSTNPTLEFNREQLTNSQMLEKIRQFLILTV